MAVSNFELARRVAALPPRISSTERLLLHTLILHRNAQTGECFPTFATLAREMGASARTVKYSAARLVTAGLLTKGKRKTQNGDGNAYALTLPAISADGATVAPTDCGTEGAIHDRRECNLRPQRVQSTTADGATVAPEQIRNRISTENETRTPQAATVSPPLSSDSVSFSSVTAHGAPDAAITAAIADAAQRLGDGLPSRDKWRRFMRAHGVAAFRAEVEKAAAAQGVEKRGAYLNRLLDAYTPPPPVHATATAPKPRTFTRGDWGLCEERCAHFNKERMACPYSRIPPEHAAYPHPPEDCRHFKPCAEYGENTPPVGLAALARGIAKTADTHGA